VYVDNITILHLVKRGIIGQLIKSTMR